MTGPYERWSPSQWRELQQIAQKINSSHRPSISQQAQKRSVPIGTIEHLASNWSKIQSAIQDSLKERILNSALRPLVVEGERHPLKSDRHLLVGTPWINDEPTLTQLLAHLFSSEIPLKIRSSLLKSIFGKEISEALGSDANWVYDTIKDRDQNFVVESEVYRAGSALRTTKRRADIVLKIEHPTDRKHLQILVEAKVSAELDLEQLTDLSAQFNDPEATCIYVFLCRSEDMEDEIGLLSGIPDWRLKSWEEIVSALELTRSQTNPYEIDPTFGAWFDLALATYWRGALSVTGVPQESLLKLALSPSFLKVLETLEKK